jgi:hypothetical protein
MAHAMLRSTLAIQSGNTIWHVGTASATPLAPTTYGYSELLGQHSCEAVAHRVVG